MKTDLSALPIGLLIGLGVVLVIELVLDVIALVDLYRRPIDRVALGNKWIWVVIIILVNLLGAILYLAIGRKPGAPGRDLPSGQAPAGRATDVADRLYGPRDDSDRP